MDTILKYPRTPHLDGSGLQAGDEDLRVAPFRELAGRYLVVKEKMDGANSGISFTADRRLLLQSRGHYLSGGPREAQFALFKSWAMSHQAELWELLGDRLVLYGEWLYAKHSVWYSDLPHYWMAYDVLDKRDGTWWDTPTREALLEEAPFIHQVPILHRGPLSSPDALRALIGPSTAIGPDHQDRLRALCVERGLPVDQVLRETDCSGLMEGLYIKVEANGETVARYKFIRPGFLQTLLDSETHWMDRPLVPNQLRPGATLY